MDDLMKRRWQRAIMLQNQAASDINPTLNKPLYYTNMESSLPEDKTQQDFNQKVLYPSISNEFKSPGKYIKETNPSLYREQENPINYPAPIIQDPEKSKGILDLLKPNKRSS